MCRPVPCTVCGKTTWAGCGDHIDQVKAVVPADQWCDGHGDPVQPTAKADSDPFRIVGR